MYETQMILINSSSKILTVKEALALCEQATKIHYAGKRYEANAKRYKYKEIGV